MKLFWFFLFSTSLFARDLNFCRNTSLHKGHSIPFNQKEKFVPQCAPKVLYSWQNSKRVEQWVRERTQKNILPLKENNLGDTALFMWIDSIGTFAYGDTAIKFLLKNNVKFKYIGADRFICKERFPFFNKNIVYVRFFRTAFGQEGSEYIICDETPIKSWSIFTRKHYQEALGSLNKILNDRAYKSWEPYIKNTTYFNAIQGSVYPLPRRQASIPPQIQTAGLGPLFSIKENTRILGYNVDVNERFWKRETLLERLLLFHKKMSSGQAKSFSIK